MQGAGKFHPHCPTVRYWRLKPLQTVLYLGGTAAIQHANHAIKEFWNPPQPRQTPAVPSSRP